MPWCPKCKTEYREGFSVCAECGSKLVNELPLEEKQTTDNGYIDYDEIINSTFLVSVENRIQSNIIQNILTDANIPSFIKDREAGTYLNVSMGDSVFGVDIFVNKSNYEKAKELVDVYLYQPQGDTYEPLTDKDNRSFYIRKKIMQAIIILFVLIPFIVFFILNAFFSFL